VCVRWDRVRKVRKRIATSKRFKGSIGQWIDLGSEHAEPAMPIAKSKGAKRAGTRYARVPNATSGPKVEPRHDVRTRHETSLRMSEQSIQPSRRD